MPFLISALPPTQFEHLFSLSPETLMGLGATRMLVTNKPGFPCRVSLEDAEIGEEVILVHYEHQSAHTPFRAGHAVFVRPKAQPANLSANQVPEMLRSRILSLRAFDREHMMVAADLADGEVLEEGIEQLFLDIRVEYLHIHFAKPGCYAARVDRASGLSCDEGLTGSREQSE